MLVQQQVLEIFCLITKMMYIVRDTEHAIFCLLYCRLNSKACCTIYESHCMYFGNIKSIIESRFLDFTFIPKSSLLVSHGSRTLHRLCKIAMVHAIPLLHTQIPRGAKIHNRNNTPFFWHFVGVHLWISPLLYVRGGLI